MGHFSDDQNNDEFMNASAEDWSKPSTPAERPTVKPEPTDRWGSPVPDKSTASDPARWGSETPAPTTPDVTAKKNGSKWWIILIVVLVLLCLCACLMFVVITVSRLNIIPPNFLQF
jgi:amino acid transporter